jgi:hypothetical protein
MARESTVPKRITDEIASKPKLYAALLIAHILVTSLVWRDLRGRNDEEVRGSKRLWRVASALNMSNSLAYLAVGRRRRSGGRGQD